MTTTEAPAQPVNGTASGGKRQAQKEQAALKNQAESTEAKSPAKSEKPVDPTKLTAEARTQLKAAVADHLLAMDVAALSKGDDRYPALRGLAVDVLRGMPARQANYVRFGKPEAPKPAS